MSQHNLLVKYSASFRIRGLSILSIVLFRNVCGHLVGKYPKRDGIGERMRKGFRLRDRASYLVSLEK